MNLSKLVLLLILFVSAFSYLIYLVLQFEVLKYKDLQVQQSFKKQNKYATEVLVSQMRVLELYRVSTKKGTFTLWPCKVKVPFFCGHPVLVRCMHCSSLF